MTTESESDRVERIQNNQINSRNQSQNHPQSRNADKYPTSKPSSRISAPKPKQKTKISYRNDPVTLKERLFGSLPSGLRDIAFGLALGVIPALLALVLLPGLFKMLGLLILLGAGGIGYMLGPTTN